MSELTFQVARITAENYRFRPPRRDAEDAVERADAFLAGAFLAATFFAGALFAGALFAGVFVATTFLAVDVVDAAFVAGDVLADTFRVAGDRDGAFFVDDPATAAVRVADFLVPGVFSVASGIATTPGTARSTLRRDAEYPVMTNAAWSPMRNTSRALRGGGDARARIGTYPRMSPMPTLTPLAA